METKLKGKTVFVTEALRHFGTPMALAFAREGANLFLATLNDHAQLAHTARTVASLGVKVVTEPCDLSREAQVEAAVQKCMSRIRSRGCGGQQCALSGASPRLWGRAL